MAKAIGRSEYIGIANEAAGALGTYVVPVVYIRVDEISLYDVPQYAMADVGGGDIFMNQDGDLERISSEGGFAGPIYSDPIGHELRALVGKAGAVAQIGSTGVYNHTFEMAQGNNHPGLSITTKEANEDLGYPYYTIDTYDVTWGPEGYARRAVSGMGRGSESKTTSTPTALDNSTKFITSQITAKLAADVAALSSADNIKAISGAINFKKNAETHWVSGRADKNPDDITNNSFDITGSLELYFEDAVQRNKVFGNTKQALEVVMTTGTGSSLRAFKITIPVVVLSGFEKNRDMNTAFRQNIEFTTVRPALTTEPFEIVLTNARSNPY